MILASVLLFAGCAVEDPTTSFDNIKLDKTYLVIPEKGGKVELTIDATEAWAFDTTYTQDVWPTVITRKKNDAGESYVSKYEASWLSVDVMSAEAGQTVLTFEADTVAGGRELELCIKAGANSQFLRVRQGSMATVTATCADIIAGPDGKTYKTKGTVTSIVNTTYGNWYLNDGTGEVYIYGTLDKDGKTKNFTSLGLEVGDVVEVEGPKTTYGTTVELVDVMVLSIQKSLVKVITAEPTLDPAACEHEVKLAFKGDGLYPTVDAEAKSWLSILGVKTYAGTPTKIEPSPADTAIVTIAVAENAEYVSRSGAITFTSASGKNSSELSYKISQKGLTPPTTPTIAEVIAAGEQAEAKTEGVVVATYGRGVLIADGTGHILVYNNAPMEQQVGDKIEVVGTTVMYGGMLQFKDLTATTLSTGNTVAHPEVKVLDGAGMDAQLSKTTIEYIEYVGTVSISSGKYYNVSVDGAATAVGSLQYIDPADFPLAVEGATVKVRGYFIGVSSSMYINTMAVSVVEADAVIEEPEAPVVKTLTNEEICAAMTSSATSYVEYTINSASGVWTVNASQLTGNTFLQCRGRKGSYIKTPEFEKDIKSVTLHFAPSKSVYADNVYCVFPASWTAPTEDAAYPETGNVGRAVTVADSYTLTIPVEAGNKQVCVSIIGTYSYYLDHIDVEL